MQRYFIDVKQIDQTKVIIQGSDVHHIKNVMRFTRGSQVILNTYEGDTYLAQIVLVDRALVELEILEKYLSKPMKYHLDLGLALTKRDAFELALKKATELGVSGFIPLKTERAIIKVQDFEKKKQRYFSICKESSEQSERPMIPKIYDLSDIKSLKIDGYEQRIFAYAREEDQGHDLLAWMNTKDLSRKTLCLIGPEGGFSLNEVSQLKTMGFESVSLGSTILRAETAALYVASAFRLKAGVEE